MQAPAAGVVRQENIVEHGRAGAAVVNLQRPLSIRGHIDRVVGHNVIRRWLRSIDLVERNASTVRVLIHIVLEYAALPAVKIDARSAARTIAVDDVVLD